MRTFLISLWLLSSSVCAEDTNSLNELRWLEGCWDGTNANGTAEECWSTAAGGIMLGYGRTISEGGKTGFEFIRIVESDKGLVFIAQPSGGPPTEFEATSVSHQFARFANPAHDFPRVIEYHLIGDQLHATIGDALTTEESENTIVFRFARRVH